MTDQYYSSEDRAYVNENFAWLGANTLRGLVVGTDFLLFLGILPYLGSPNEFWPGWGIPLFMIVMTSFSLPLIRKSYKLASTMFFTVLLFGGTSILWIPEQKPLVAFLFLPIVLVSGAVHRTVGVLVTAGVASLAVICTRAITGTAIEPVVMSTVLALIWITALTSWATTRNLHTALSWAWADRQQAARNLDEARDYQGKLASTLHQLQEATHRLERANYALSWARAEAIEARRIKAQFAANVSHELRTPLNLVVGFAELMLHNPETYGNTLLPSAYQSDLAALYRNATHLEGMVNDILDLSQIDDGQMPIVKEPSDIAAIVREATAIAGPLGAPKSLQISMEVQPNLPLLNLDRLRIRQVLLNLISNAVRFTDAGGIVVKAQLENSDVVVEVTDTGLGIKQADIDKLFQPFHQLESSVTRGRGGTGLGLAVSKEFVELHGGRIWVSSDGVSGRGSTFHFTLPLLPEDKPSLAVTQEDPSQVRRRLSAPPAPTIIVMDDDPAIVGLFQRHMTGYRVEPAVDNTTAIALAARLQAHAIVTDLPRTDQLSHWHEAALRLAKHGQRLLACPMPSGRRLARTLGVAEYLPKPTRRENLLRAVESTAPAAHTVLVVDDDPQMVRLLCQMLRSSSRGYELLRAYSGEQAMELMALSPPDVVLLDLIMPGTDGLSVLAWMQTTPVLARIPVIAVTAYGAVESITPSDGRSLVLISDLPFTVSHLLRTVQVLLDQLPPVEAQDRPIAPESG